MKKTIAMLLVAMLAVSSVFAAFSGSADIQVGVDLNNEKYGILDQSTGFTMGFELASAEGENAGEGDVYASIKGSMVLEVFKAPDHSETPAADDKKVDGIAKWNDAHYIGLGLSIDEAKIAGSNWYLSILGMPGEPDFAKSEIDTWKSAKKSYGIVVDKDGSTSKASVAMEYYSDDYGVELGIADYVIGGGIWGSYADGKESLIANGYVMTPEFDFDGLSLQIGAAGSMKQGAGTIHAGASAKVGYATDALSLSVASDVVLGIPSSNGDFEFGLDVAAAFTYDFVDVDVYYATDVKVNSTPVENLLSFKAAFDLNSFDVPVSVTAGIKDVINLTDIFAEASTSIEGVSLTLSGDFAVQAEKDWSVELEAGYALDFGTITGTVGYAGDNSLTTEVVFETETLVPGATITLGWEDADLLNDKFGVISAACSIEF